MDYNKESKQSRDKQTNKTYDRKLYYIVNIFKEVSYNSRIIN